MRIDSKMAAARLLEMDDITLLCHRDPDGDTYGSASALFDALSAMGKQVNIHCPDPFPANLAYLHREMPRFETKHFVAIDMAASSMLGDPKETRPAVELNIDHHPTNPLFAKETFLCSYAAAGEAVYEVIREMGAPVSPFCATALFTALSSDTGGFRYANTTTQTLRYAADLMELGADTETIRVQLFESKSCGRIAVEAEALSHVRYYAGGRIAVIAVTTEMVERAGVDESELEGLASKPLTIIGVDIGITLKERADGSIRVSMRSNDQADVSAVCRRFEGGGHIRAAGCRIWKPLAEAEAVLVNACLEELS